MNIVRKPPNTLAQYPLLIGEIVQRDRNRKCKNRRRNWLNRFFGRAINNTAPNPTNEINQYRPAFFEGFENETVAFDTIKQLLAIPWVANFASAPNFHQFSVSDNKLMAEYRGGREWWVCGFFKHPVTELPKWDHGLYEVWDGIEPKDIPGTEVSWSCGDKVGLRNGKTLKRRV